MKPRILPFSFFIFISFLGAFSDAAELRIPAATAYIDPDPNGARVSDDGISHWTDPSQRIAWFGELKSKGKLSASVQLRIPNGASRKFKLTIGNQSREASASGDEKTVSLDFGGFEITGAGYVKFELTSVNPHGEPAGDIEALTLSGPGVEGAHFNLKPRRNAASVHLSYPLPPDEQVALFYNEITGVEDPVATFYMACGFSRGYFGMQVNSPTERRIIFSVWDSGSGADAKDRSTVDAENHTQLVAKGEHVKASVFGNEGTGGHSHLVYPWKTGSTQRFTVTAKPDGTATTYTGYWFHPEEKAWKLIASFRAPKDGKWLRGLHSFSENFGGSNGHLRRKSLFGPAWIQLKNQSWREITEASFSHDGTGKSDRLDRFMGVENGRFFLSHGGFIPGSTPFGERFTRPASGPHPDDLHFPPQP